MTLRTILLATLAATGYGAEHTSVMTVVAAEGNYDVTVRLGSAFAPTTTTVRAEARRLMLEQVHTEPGQFVTRTFTVNVRHSEIDAISPVKLKPREIGSLNWDKNLTVAFYADAASLHSISVVPAPDSITVFLAGDSTVVDQQQEPWSAWGQMLPRFFRAGVAVANHAESGESLKSFIGERRLAKLLTLLKRGDYVFLQFAHNDQKPGNTHLDPFTTYTETLRHFIEEIRKRGATPVLVTSMHRRTFDDAGRIRNSLDDYPEAMRRLAQREKLTLIDLNAMSKTLFEALGPEGSKRAFVHYPAGTFPGQSQALADDTHFNAYGAYQLARCVVEGIRTSGLDLAKQLAEDVTPFDPARPGDPASWRLPPTVGSTTVKPEGR